MQKAPNNGDEKLAAAVEKNAEKVASEAVEKGVEAAKVGAAAKE